MLKDCVFQLDCRSFVFITPGVLHLHSLRMSHLPFLYPSFGTFFHFTSSSAGGLKPFGNKYVLFKVLLRSCILAGSTSLQLSLWSSRRRCQSSVASKCCSRHGQEGPQCLQTLFSSTLLTKSPASTFTPV